MKKIILLFVCITALTIVNFIKIENKAELNSSLSSLILAAKADEEGGGPCYDWYAAGTENIIDECHKIVSILYWCEKTGWSDECKSGYETWSVYNCEHQAILMESYIVWLFCEGAK